MHQTKREQHRKTGCDRLLSQITHANRSDVAYLLTVRTNAGIATGSNENWLRAIVRAEASNPGKPFRTWTPPELTTATSRLKEGVAPRTFVLHAQLFRHFLRELHGDDALPKEVNRATKVKKGKQRVVGNVVTDAMLDAMMAWCKTARGPSLSLPFREEAECILAVARHTGLRAGELLALHVGDVRFDEGGVWLTLREGMEGLKTGARTLYVVGGVPYLKAWLGLHPGRACRDAPLFCGFTSKDGARRLQYQDLNDLVRRCAEESGANAMLARNDNITLHDFRHTCATEKARLRWSEAQMRMFFGWSPTSNMAATYVHMNLDDLRAAIRRDSGLDGGHMNAGSRDASVDDHVDVILGALAKKLVAR
ncbi:MAG: site-specific integrase [Candidatus Thermoplasmatota archaeon]